MTKKTKEAICEIEVPFSVIGGKWKPLILWFLGEFNTLRFGQLQHLLPNISHKTLTNQLKNLEEDNLIERTVYPEVPPKVEYTINENGKEIIPILRSLCGWSHKNNHFSYSLKHRICDMSLKEPLILNNNK